MKGTTWTRAAGVALLSVMAPMTSMVSAQAAKCEIKDNSPYQLAGARQYVINAANTRRDDEIPKHLANSIRVLTTDPEKIKNEPGRLFLLIRTYSQYLQRTEGEYEFSRGELGFTTNAEGRHNILLAVDSAATALEAMMPECKATVRPYRLKFFTDILNKSINLMQAEEDDSAAYYAVMSLSVSGGDPRPWNVLSSLYSKLGKTDSAMIAMQKVIDLSGKDSTFMRVRQQNRYNLAVLRLQQAEAASGEAREADITRARALLEDYLRDQPGDANASQALGRALRLSGDTVAVATMFADMIKTPDKFTADQLFEAGSNAAAGGRDEDAASLFEAGFTKNPYHRFALYNYANVEFSAKNHEKMGPAVKRLMEVDPNFENGWRLLAGYWQLRARAENEQAKKRVYNDSVLFYLDKQTKVNPRIDITQAVQTGSGYQMGGMVVNNGEKSASWTMQVELLDSKGEVVTTKDVAIGPVEPGSGTTFSLKVESPNVVAFRYAPLK
jgi:tetratricopeptide (TPR) repeat protein